MTSLTMEFKGVQKEVIEKAVKRGYARTKSEAVRMALLEFGRNTGLITPGMHARAKTVEHEPAKKGFYDFAGAWKGMSGEDAKALRDRIEKFREKFSRSAAERRKEFA